jgi:glucose-6-phosphate isomerase
MFAGEAINTTEGRAVLHTALRAANDADIRVDGENVVPGVHAVLDAMGTFSDGVRNGSTSAPPASRSPTWSISASAVRISVR